MMLEPENGDDTQAEPSVNGDNTGGGDAKEQEAIRGAEELTESATPAPEDSDRSEVSEGSSANDSSSEPQRLPQGGGETPTTDAAAQKEPQELRKVSGGKSGPAAHNCVDDESDDNAARIEGKDENHNTQTASNEWQGINLLRSRSPRPLIQSDPFFLEDNSPQESSSRSPTARNRKKSPKASRRSHSRGSLSSSPTASSRKQRRVRWRRRGEASVVEQVQFDAEARMQNSHFPGTNIRQWCDPKRAPNSNAGYVVPNDDLCHERVRTVSFGSTPRFPEPTGTRKMRPQSSAGRKSPSERADRHQRPGRRHSWALGFSDGPFGSGNGSGSTARDVGFSRTERTTPLLWAPPYLKGGIYSEKFVRASTSKAAPGADVKKSTIGGYMGQCKTRFQSQDPRSYLPWQDCGPGPSGHVPNFSTSPIGATFSKTTAPRRVIDTSIMHGNESPGPASPNVNFEKLINAEVTKPRVSIAHRFGRGYTKDQEELKTLRTARTGSLHGHESPPSTRR